MESCSLRDAFLFHEFGHNVQCLLCLIAHAILALQSTSALAIVLRIGDLVRACICRLTISGILDDMMIY